MNTLSRAFLEIADYGIPIAKSESTITIARRKEKSALVKMTYYLRPDQVQAIDDLHDQSGRDKSELVLMALEIVIERAKVE